MEKIKMADIRAQFPMYENVSDEQLLIGLRQKYYKNIPAQDFYNRIEFDAPDPTDGMSTLDKLRAGVGKGMADVARGAGQLVGKVSRDDVAESRRLDRALSNTTAGKVGNVVGSVAAIAPTMFIPGAATLGGAAAIGAGTGALAPSVSTEETMKNAALGGVLGVGGNLAGRAVGALWNAGKGLVQPFTEKGRESIAAATLKQFATDPAKAAKNLSAAQEIVPGSAPTMAQAADDVGIAQLERTLVNNQETGGRIAEQYAAQRAARLSAIGDVAGNPAKRAAAVAEREAVAAPLYAQAKGAVYEMDPALDMLLKTPIGRQAMARAKSVAENNQRQFQFTTETSAPFKGVGGAQVQTQKQVTGQALHDLKMALDDMLDDPMSGIAKSEANAVKNIRSKLINWMEGQNEAFRTARTTFAEKSVPINTMDVADALMKKLEPALARYGATTKEHASAYAQALEAAKETVKKQTGINKPMDDVIDKKAAKILEDIAKDLGRKVKAEDMGRATGSNTVQNLSSQNLLRRTLGPTGLPQSWAESTALQSLFSPVSGLARMAGGEQRVLDILADAATDPAMAARLLQLAQQQAPTGLLGTRTLAAMPLAPVGGLLASTPQ